LCPLQQNLFLRGSQRIRRFVIDNPQVRVAFFHGAVSSQENAICAKHAQAACGRLHPFTFRAPLLPLSHHPGTKRIPGGRVEQRHDPLDLRIHLLWRHIGIA